jgi:bifunctional UDP-N-acetylglucosamine pyrophosphorylase/glucosamine-1-phosphate N-acetyltransferase
MTEQIAGIILAAGMGTRMKSQIPKVLHEVCGVPMVELVARAMRDAGVERIVLVIGHGADQVKSRFGDQYEYVIQDPPRGTGDAARVGMTALADFTGTVLISSGDTPLQTGACLRALVDRKNGARADAVVATVRLEDPTGYGRVLQGSDWFEIVEEKDIAHREDLASRLGKTTDEIRALNEVCVSVYAFDANALRDALPKLSSANAQGEFYLTDVPKHIAEARGTVITDLNPDPALFAGVNDRVQLASASMELRNRINVMHMRNGVTMIDPTSIYIGLDVQIGQDTILHPDIHLEGNTKIGCGCEIGPNVRIRNTVIGDNSSIHHSVALESQIGDKVKIGPYATLRNGADIGTEVKLGNFVEIKNSRLDTKVSVAHLSYIGDARVGEFTNIGAGTITCNYDGFAKHKTTIGARAFVGTNSTLIAPVAIGDGAIVAAGSVINRDVPPGAGAFGRARQETKEEWADRWRAMRTGAKNDV